MQQLRAEAGFNREAPPKTQAEPQEQAALRESRPVETGTNFRISLVRFVFVNLCFVPDDVVAMEQVEQPPAPAPTPAVVPQKTDETLFGEIRQIVSGGIQFDLAFFHEFVFHLG